MAEEGAKARDERGSRSGKISRKQYRDRALEGVAEQRRGGEAFAPGAQHVGRADIAGADGAYVRAAGRFRQQQAERN